MYLRVLLICLCFSISALAQKQQKFLDAGLKLISEEKYELAIGELKNAIAANPKFAESYYQRGNTSTLVSLSNNYENDLIRAAEKLELIIKNGLGIL